MENRAGEGGSGFVESCAKKKMSDRRGEGVHRLVEPFAKIDVGEGRGSRENFINWIVEKVVEPKK